MTNKLATPISFQGYSSPNYTPIPDELFDEQLPDLSGAELKVLLYIMRRTFGFKKGSDRISKAQLENGIRRKDGEVLDRGTGLSRRAIRLALDSLVKRNLLIKYTHTSEERGYESTEYAVNMKGSSDPWVLCTQAGGKKVPKPLGRGVPIQETVLQETDLHHRDISRSTALNNSGEEGEGNNDPYGRERNTPEVVGQPRHPDRGTPPSGQVLTPIAALLTEKQTLLDHRKNARFSKEPPPPELEAAIRDVSAKLADTNHMRENISQATNLYRAWGGVHGSSFASSVYEACAITRQQARVKKQMPYFFQVLKDLLGLTGVEQGSVAPG